MYFVASWLIAGRLELAVSHHRCQEVIGLRMGALDLSDKGLLPKHTKNS